MKYVSFIDNSKSYDTSGTSMEGTISRVGPKYIKFSDQAPNWAKVVPWYGV